MMIFSRRYYIYIYSRILIYKFIKLIRLLLEILIGSKVSILCTQDQFDNWKLEIIFI